MFVVASFKYLTSKGDPTTLADARSMLTNAIIGFLIIASAFVIVQVLNSAFNAIDHSINILGPFKQ